MPDFLPPTTKIKIMSMYIGSNYSRETSKPGMNDKGEKGAKPRKLVAKIEHHCLPAASLGQFYRVLTATLSAASGPQMNKSNRNSKALPSSSGLPARSPQCVLGHPTGAHFSPSICSKHGQHGLTGRTFPSHAVAQAPSAKAPGPPETCSAPTSPHRTHFPR